MINKKEVTKKGFTLIEVLVAVFILVTAVVVPLTISSKGIFYSNVVRDQSIASYLAQEAMEFVRVTRDNAFLGQDVNVPNSQVEAWRIFLSAVGDCGGENGCMIDENNFVSCGDCVLYINSQEKYGTKGDPSSFTRVIKTTPVGDFTTPSNPPRVRVEVTVSWKTNSLERSVTITNYLTPWQI